MWLPGPFAVKEMLYALSPKVRRIKVDQTLSFVSRLNTVIPNRAFSMRGSTLFVLILLSFAVVSCDSSDSEVESESWDLATIGGKELPVIIQSVSSEVWTTSESFTLKNDRSFTVTTQLNRITDGQALKGEESGKGTYEREGESLVMTFDSGASWELVVSGNRATREGLCYLPDPVECDRVYLRQ
jgi:hypothetical protein